MTVGEYPEKVPAEYLISFQAFESKAEFPRFTNISAQVGLDTFDLCGGAIIDDGDRFPDLYVSNMRQENRLYANQKDGTFKDVAVVLGVSKPILSFPVWFWDFDNEGHLELRLSTGISCQNFVN